MSSDGEHVSGGGDASDDSMPGLEPATPPGPIILRRRLPAARMRRGAAVPPARIDSALLRRLAILSAMSTGMHQPHTAGEVWTGPEIEEAVAHAYRTFCVGAANTATWPSPRPTAEVYRNLVDIGLVGQLLWYRRTYGVWPESAELLVETMLPQMCLCNDEFYHYELQRDAYAHLVHLGQGVRCRLLPYAMMFHAQEGRWPSYDQWDLFVTRFRAFARNPEEFFQDDRVHVPVRGLSRLPVTTLPEPAVKGGGDDCAMCLSDLEGGQQVVVLQPCGHTFHATGTDCIGRTVVDWLRTDNSCPKCRSEVVVP